MPDRKTVSVDALRQILGDSRTDDLLEKLTPSRPTIAVDARSLRLARTLFADPIKDSSEWAETLPVLRRYFLERGQARRGLLAWLDQSPAGAVDGTPAEQPPRRARRRSARG